MGEIERRVFIGTAVASSTLVACGLRQGDDLVADPPADPPAEADEANDIFDLDVEVGELQVVLRQLRNVSPFLFVPQARSYVVEYPAQHVDAALKIYPEELHDGLRAGFLALYQRCPHLGCRVPECESSGQFECPCHASVFTPYGERLGGPSPRGLDLFALSVRGDVVFIDTSVIITGLERGTDVTKWKPLGDSCIGNS